MAALIIGSIRQGQLSGSPPSESALERSVPLLQSEFAPVIAYGEIKDYEAVLGRRYGATIVWPLLFKLVPRGLAPGKPLNSGAYYMSVVRPAEFSAGYGLPPTLFGDMRVNFGPWGPAVACLLVGVVSARLDRAYREPRLTLLPWFIIVAVSFYSLLRSPISETLSSLLLTLAVFVFLRRAIVGRRTPLLFTHEMPAK